MVVEAAKVGDGPTVKTEDVLPEAAELDDASKGSLANEPFAVEETDDIVRANPDDALLEGVEADDAPKLGPADELLIVEPNTCELMGCQLPTNMLFTALLVLPQEAVEDVELELIRAG